MKTGHRSKRDSCVESRSFAVQRASCMEPMRSAESVNVIPEPLPFASDRASSFMRTGFTLSGASNNLELGGAARAEGARGSFGWRVAATGRYGSNLHTPAGELDNTGFGALNGEGSPDGAAREVRWRCASSTTAVSSNCWKRTQHPVKRAVRRASWGRPSRAQRRSAGRFLAAEAKGQFQRHRLIEVSDSASTESEAFNLLLQTASLDLLAHHSRGKGLRGTLGLSGLAASNNASAAFRSFPDATLATGGAFAFEAADRREVELARGRTRGCTSPACDRDSTLSVSDQTPTLQRLVRGCRPRSSSSGALWPCT